MYSVTTGASSSSDDPNRHKRCRDPFNYHQQWKSRDLRPVSQATVQSHPSLDLELGDKLCTQCRKRVSCHEEKLVDEKSISSSDAESMMEDFASDPKLLSPTDHLSILNSSLSVLGLDVLQSVNTDHQAVKFSDLKGYITAKYDGHWWLGCVMQKFADQNEVEINFLHPHGPARSFRYPNPADLLMMSCMDVLTAGLQPTTSTGRAYTLNAQEMLAATRALESSKI